MKIEYDLLEKKFNSKYRVFAFVVLVSYFVFEIGFLKNDYYNLSFFIPLVLFLPYIPNYFFLKKIKCPYCRKNYFTPFFAGKEDIKSLLKSNPKCVNCHNEVEIISEYKNMY